MPLTTNIERIKMTDETFRKEVKGYLDTLGMYVLLTIFSGIFLVGMPAYFGNLVFPSIIAFTLVAIWVCIVREIHNSKGTNDWYNTLEYMFCENKYSILEPGRKYLLQGFDVEVQLKDHGMEVYEVTLTGREGAIPHDMHPYYQDLLAAILLKKSTEKPASQVENALTVLTRNSTYHKD